MRTIIETLTFKKQADTIWTEEERLELISYIAANPMVGTLIPNGEGVRKIRWSAQGKGKRGGARVIYFIPDNDTLWLLAAYTKNQQENIPSHTARKLKDEY